MAANCRVLPITFAGASSGSMGASVNTDAVSVGNYSSFAFHLQWSGGGSPAGTWKLQGSCDRVDGPAGVANWVDIASATSSVSADGGWIYTNTANPPYAWVRGVFTRTSGTATVTGNVAGRDATSG